MSALNVCDGVMKVTLVMKVCRFCNQILSMRLLCLCFSSIDVQTLHNPITYVIPYLINQMVQSNPLNTIWGI